MNDDVLLKIDKDGCHIYINDSHKVSLNLRDEMYAKVEAEKYAKALGLKSYMLMELGKI